MMGLSGWQQNLTVSEQIAQSIAQEQGAVQQQNLSAFIVGIGVLALLAIGIAAPELLPFLFVGAEEGEDVVLTKDVVAMLYRLGYESDTIDELFSGVTKLSDLSAFQ